MHGLLPYRAPMPATRRFVPSLSWTRPAAVVVALLGTPGPALAVYELLADKECEGQASPHYGAAAMVFVLAGALAGCAILLRRRVARWVSRRVSVSSSLIGGVVASMTLLPVVLLDLVSAALAGWVDIHYTFRICLNGVKLSGLDYGWGC